MNRWCSGFAPAPREARAERHLCEAKEWGEAECEAQNEAQWEAASLEGSSRNRRRRRTLRPLRL